MTIERQILRDNVTAQIGLASASGIWEDQYLDFKRELEPRPHAIAKTLKLILAFANAPRNREAYIIYGVTERSEDGRAHVGADQFPSKEHLEQCIREYTDLEGVIIDTDFILDGKRTPYIVIPLQDQGPYRFKKLFAQAPKAINPTLIYLRSGSHTVIAGEFEQRKMRDWATWFWDGRYIPSLVEMQSLIQKTFPNLQAIESCGDYVRFITRHTTSDIIGTQHRLVLGHAYPGLKTLSDDQVERLYSDSLPATHDRWLLCHSLYHSSTKLADNYGIRVLKIDEIFIASDAYAKYCRVYLKEWQDYREKTNLRTVADLDFKLHGETNRQLSSLSWLEGRLHGESLVPTVVYGEFGTGKSITLHQLVANVCNDYLRRVSTRRAIYVDLNSIDIRADKQSFVERALLSLPSLSRPEIDELGRQVDQNEIHLVLDSVDEMARPYSIPGRREAFHLIQGNINSLPCVLAVRPNYFASTEEMLERIKELAGYDPKRRERNYGAVELCDLTWVQVEELVSSGLADQEDSVDVKGLLNTLRNSGLGQFLKDPLVLSLVLARLRTTSDVSRLFEYPRKASLVNALLNDIINREIKKRQKHRAPLSFEEFHELLTWLAYIMTKNESRSFSIEQVEKFIEARVKSEHSQSDITKEMTEQFRTQTWLHAEEGKYRFRHEVFTHMLAAQYILQNLRSENLSYIEDWNSDAGNASTVVDFVRELLEPTHVIAAAAALEATPTAYARGLILAILRQHDQFPATPAKIDWIKAPQMQELLGKAIKASVSEQEVSGAVISCVYPAIPRSNLAVDATLCFLVLAKQRLGPGGVEILRQARILVEELSNLRSSNGHYLNFEDLLSEKRNAGSYNERLVKAAGLNTREFVNPAMYEPVFSELTQQLSDTIPIGRYVRHAAQYLTSYVKSQSGRRKQR